MQHLKRTLKRILPPSLKRLAANWYHLGEAIAANVRYGFPARGKHVIMITGTNGKTTTAAFLIKILQAGGHIVGASTTAFYQIGDETIPNAENMTTNNVFKVQELLHRMKKAGCDYIVMETTSHALVQHRVWGIPCEVAVMTNLTQDHLDYHGTMENYAAAKAKLFAREPRFIVLNHDDEWFDYYNEYPAKELKMNYGTDPDAECRITNVRLRREGSDVQLQIDKTVELDFSTNLAGKFNVYNATAAAATAYLLHVDLHHISQGVRALTSVPGRLERIDEGQNFEVVVDYAHTEDALKNLLETLRGLTKNRLILVFGATGDRDKTKRPIMGEVAVAYADRIVLTDDEPYTENPDVIRDDVRRGIERAGGGAKTDEIGDRKAAIEKAIGIARKGDIIAITGMGHEQFRVIGDGEKIAWNDGAVAREILRARPHQ
ncbi:MAG TPA: UDP-N-acetylmuramoyl-L-alanyl-D-glutamate--2,6-diaminopimelate ligase [Candidatus Saccharimonadales bacterium]|nr:UDP-N-acetylmuramoyl-L-alanyl-D-glutamate--2,6-diaminopimelate ligase [Candidatus Saccharimonadales bacterium]